MHENRTTYPKRKTEMYQQLLELPKKYKTISIIKMAKVRSTQILPLRKTLKGEVEFVCVKDRVARKALETLDVPGMKEFSAELKGQVMFIFTNMSPFKLNVLLGKNKVMMNARGGDIASMDIVVAEKNTGIAPGPMLTEFKEAGIPNKNRSGNNLDCKGYNTSKERRSNQ
jgi:Ribosomal protein L10